MLKLSIIVFFLLLASGLPLFIAFASGGMMIISLHSGMPLYNLGIFFFDSINNSMMLAVPLFILAGQFLVNSGMGKYLVDFINIFVGRIPGGLALTAIITSAFVGSLTGQNLAVLGSVGVVLFPSMVASRYGKGFSGGILCASSQLGFLIPPSVVFIIYGFMMQTSIIKLFISGIVPGFLLTVMLCLTSIFLAKRRKISCVNESGLQAVTVKLLMKSLPALMMPIIVLGGIYSGIFTATEAAAVACVYTLMVGTLVYKTLNWNTIWQSAVEASRITGMILILFCGVMVLGKAFTIIGLPQMLGNWVVSAGLTPQRFLMLLCLAFIALGMLMDAFAMIAILPAVMPSAKMLNIDPIHLGTIFIVASMIGTMTPPAAASIYFTSGLFGIPTSETIKGVVPFLLTTVLLMFLLVLFPQISTWLPELVF